ncbi:MAG: GTP 3',8-cyclase MoaA [Gemmatimonadetes bacterium]|nr:GTP 3',8-cyclase MoaA [Gemmatimonadota bacterium]
MTAVLDRFARPLGSLRLSVTDRCNMRCGYCMPNADYVWLPRSSILSFEELDRLAGIFASLGAGKVRLTGGEPLLRHDLPALVRLVAARSAIGEVTLTTNGILLADQAKALRQAGLGRVTISLDTLSPARLKAFAKTDRHGAILAGLDSARRHFPSVKLNSVIIRGYNEDEVVGLLEFSIERGIELRYIEYMDVGGATGWDRDQVVSRAEILDLVAKHFGPPIPIDGRGQAPAETFELPGGHRFGVIASTTAPFCGSCDRSRVTADGTWYLCLYADRGVDLRQPLRDGATDADLAALVSATWAARTDRGAEQRVALAGRGVLHAIEGLRADPRREMHTRGG